VSYTLARFGLAVLPWGNEGKPGPMGAKVKAQISFQTSVLTVREVWPRYRVRHIEVTLILRRSSLEMSRI